METFEDYTEPKIPTLVRRIDFTISSILVDELDENGEPTGVILETEAISASAIIEDQDGMSRWRPSAGDYQTLLDLGIVTVSQLQVIQTWIQNKRDIIEGKVLPQD